MKRYQKYNPKRRLAAKGAHSCAKLANLAAAVKYTGNPEHKRNRGDFTLTPPAQPRRGKSLCDNASVFSRCDALKYLQEGIRKGLVSEQFIGDWPKVIWAVTEDGVPLEAQRDGEGSYHGYPMPQEDPMAAAVKRRWGEK